MRRIALLLLALIAVSAAVTQAAPAKRGSFPTTIQLPNGWRPEGIATGTGTTFYSGSIPNGAIYRGDLRTGEGAVFIQGVDGHAATGLKTAHGMLFVSGAGTGKGFVYDLGSGALLREYQLANGSGATFINDVVVTRTAAYFTDSNRAVIYKVALEGHGALPEKAEEIPLSGAFALVAGLNLNGIDATPNGHTLIAVQTATGNLFTIDPDTGVAAKIDLGGATLVNGDGILLHGKTLYVVQNQNNQIAVVRLTHDLSHGSVERTITDPGFDVPTTLAEHGSRLYAVNARFTTPPTATTPYTIVQIRR